MENKLQNIATTHTHLLAPTKSFCRVVIMSSFSSHHKLYIICTYLKLLRRQHVAVIK